MEPDGQSTRTSQIGRYGGYGITLGGGFYRMYRELVVVPRDKKARDDESSES